MRVITASTPEQQHYVKSLIEELYVTVFPYFFSDNYIKKLKNFELMQAPNLEELSLTEIMEVTAAFQTITTILKQLGNSDQIIHEYEDIFSKNTKILSKYNIDFPFQLIDFLTNNHTEVVTNKKSLYM
ncbi:DUF5365 family protein [Aquibacillus rhizosphaerae]|uniref:DUF5365 family protein n=1 Tax=Aquibacillus rhizosphaerae TaxID=3051431 RepID=A0ABT7L1I9_9BACI|nr:DUF5365 family protein [Aquibacillus sp. LR5S19]MDL4839712.1 DUF5365 family protein [Aquibacillus sp. LR5S19]